MINIYIRAIGKPTMTAADRWKKRPCIMRYREWCDQVRAQVPTVPDPADIGQVVIRCYFTPPASLSDRKRRAMIGQPCRVKPDYDNICKALGDVLWPGCDQQLPGADVLKFWGHQDRIDLSFRPVTEVLS